MNVKNIKHQLLGTLIIILLIFMVALLFPKLDNDIAVSTTSVYDTSKSSVVLDLYNNEILYENNAHEKMLPASLTKVLTASVAWK